MAQTIQTRFVLRNDSNENWTLVADTAILLKGEPAIEFIDGSAPKMKIGDGEHTWAELPYVSGEGGTATLPEKFRWGDLTGAVGTDTTATTTNLELTKPASGDVVSVHTLNQNADKLDTAYENLDTKIKVNSNQVSELVNNFTENASYDAAEVIDIRAGYDGETYQSAGDAVRQIGYNLKDLQDNLGDFVNAEMVNGLMYEDSKLYLTSNGVVIGDPVTITGGSGTGGGGSSYSISLTNLMDSRVLSYAKGETITLRFRYTSIDGENYNDGAGICTISVGGLQKAVISANQGNNEVNITNYVADGANQVKVTVENSEGNKKTLAYTVNVLALAVTTTLSNMSMYTGNVAVPYIVTGAGQKTVYFQLDNDLLGKEVIETSGRSRVFNLNDIADGAHILKIWAEVENQGSKVHSNTLYLGMMFHSETMTDQAVLINYQGAEITQGDTLSIPYMVYDPFAEDVEIHLNIYNSDKTLYSSKHLTIDHTPKTWVTQDFPIGEKVKFEIVCGNSDNSITLKVNESDFKQTIIKDSMELEFTAANRSNAEDNPGEWHYNDIVATFSGFGWEGADGWVEDEDGQTVLRFLPDDTMFIPFKPFATDFRGNGYTIEAEIATHNVRDYDSIVVESLNKGTGFQIKSQQASLSSEQSKVSIQFKEDSKVRIAFVVEQQNLNRFIYVYINGVMCGVTQYPESDNFKQVEPAGITIGAESCGLDLYVLRFYSKGLTRHEQLNNFICDRPTLAARKEAYERNNVLDSNDQVALASLPLSIPYMILECEELPQYKGDKKKDKSLTYVEPLHPERSFTAAGVQFNVQGTSSQGYPVKNYKADCKKGIDYTLSGEHAKGWPINVGDLETTCFCLKADFASSENANNTCLAGYYDELVPYKTPAQEADDRVQTTVRGNPIVVFWRNTETNDIKFLGKYNLNVDKSNENIFGFNRETYPALECWEFLNNTSNRTLFKSADFTSTNADGNPAWLDDFEARFPDLDEPYQDYTALKRFAEWLVSTDRDAEGLTEEGKTARLQKFKDEYSQYMTLTPYIYYYIFTEVFLMVDSRAKNLFLTTWDGVHWEPFCYDLDTANGIV